MKDTELYQQILGVTAPWKVAEVLLEMEFKRVTVRVELQTGTKWGDPETGASAHLHKWTERKWRHLDTCQFETIIKASVPSVIYPDGKVEEVSVPWADRYQRVTRLFAQAVIMWLEACGNVDKVAKIMRLDWSTVDSIMKAAVTRGLKRREAEPISSVGMDEKSFRRGHVYASLLNDLDNNRVWDLVEGRKTENAAGLLETLREGQRVGVKAVAMDIWPAFEAGVREKLPHADIVYDKFHISAYLNNSNNDGPKQKHMELMGKGKDTLKWAKYQWMRNFPDLGSEPSFRDLYSGTLKTSRAWRLKESFAGLWDYRYRVPAEKFFADWRTKVKRSKLTPMSKVAEILANRLEGLLNYLKHRITNAIFEGMNSLVARVVGNARGLRSFATFRIRVRFFLGKLDLSIA